jgi:hypothetical protein
MDVLFRPAFCEARRLELGLPALGRRGYIYLLCGDVYVASECFKIIKGPSVQYRNASDNSTGTPEPYARQ